MSAEMITTIASLVALLLALAGGFGWMIQRTDRVRQDLGNEFRGVRQEIKEVGDELGEAEVAMARLEGPLIQRLALPR